MIYVQHVGRHTAYYGSEVVLWVWVTASNVERQWIYIRRKIWSFRFILMFWGSFIYYVLNLGVRQEFVADFLETQKWSLTFDVRKKSRHFLKFTCKKIFNCLQFFDWFADVISKRPIYENELITKSWTASLLLISIAELKSIIHKLFLHLMRLESCESVFWMIWLSFLLFC